MKLHLETLRPAILGVATAQECEDGIHFHRFTAAQEEVYRTSNFYRKNFATAGVQLHFRTNSRRLSLDVTCSSGSSRNFCFTDVICNGRVIGHVGSYETNTGRFGNEFDLGDGEKEIRIVFPWSTKTVLNSLELDDGSSFIGLPRKRKVLIFGDSITHGYDAKYPSHSYASILTEYLRADARNKAIGGEKFFPPLVEEKEDFDPELIWVAYGTNDWASEMPKEELTAKATSFFSLLSAHYPKAKIVAVSPIWRGDEFSCRQDFAFSEVEEILKAIAQKTPEMTVISGYNLIPHDAAYFSPDVLHPNDAGFAFYAERLWKEIQQVLA